MFMLRRRNLWSCSCGLDYSLALRKLMKLRAVAVDFIRYMVGNGRDVWIWQANWHPFGPLIRRFGSRIVYDLASRHDLIVVSADLPA